jgi:hypothetical protein
VLSRILPCDYDDMAIPPQTPDYQRRVQKQGKRRGLITDALFVVGVLLIVAAWEKRTVMPGVVWVGVVVLGVVLMVLSVLIPFRRGRAAMAAYEKDLALREPGTVQLLTVASSPFTLFFNDEWKLTSDMQIRLDSGHTFSGSYEELADSGPLGRRAKVRPFDAWFRVGATLRCLVNPTNSDSVWVFPFAAPGDALRPPPLNAMATEDFFRFRSAT